jgi:hypothetical protein
MAIASASTSNETRASELASGDGAVRGEVALLLRLEGAAVLVAATAAYGGLGGRWTPYVLLFLVPDLSMLGYLANPRFGARVYNAGHSYVSPGLLAAAGFWGHWPVLIPLALIWCAHIGIDRLLGFGLKYPQAFQVTHLGWRGKRNLAA